MYKRLGVVMRRLTIGVGMLVLLAVTVIAVGSSSGEFTASSPVYANWTNSYSAVTVLVSNTSNYAVDVQNATSNVKNSTFNSAPFSVLPNDTNVSVSGTTNVTLAFNTAGLAPGRYSGSIIITKSANTTENASITATLDVPLNVNQNGQGTVSGNVATDTYELHYINMTAVSAYGLRVNLTSATALPINLTIKDGSGNVLRTASFNTVNSTQLDYTSAQTGYWLLNWTAGSAASFNASVELLEPSLLGNGVPGAVTVTNRTNRGYNTTLTTYFWLNNSADYDINISSITSSNLLNLTTNSSKSMQIASYSIGPGWNLSTNNGTLVTVNIAVNTLNTSDGAGNYVGWLGFTGDRGYPNSTINVTFTVNLTGALDLSAVTFANESGGTNILPGSRLNITMLPKWQNGTAITNLMVSNFGVWIYHQNYDSLSNATLRNLTLSINNATWNGTAYLLNASINSAALGGNYTLYVSAAENNSLNSGSAAAVGVLTVNESALRLSLHDNNRVDISGTTSVSLSGGSTWKAYANVTNFGVKNASAVNVIRSLSGTCISFTSGAGATIGLGDLGPGTPAGLTNNTVKDDLSGNIWTFTAANASSSCSITFTANASGTAWDRQSITVTFTTTVSGGSGSSSGGSSGQQGSNSSSSNTTSTEMTILDWPKETYIVQGNSQSFNVRVKNSGGTQLDDVMVAVEGIQSNWWSSADKRMLPKGTFSDWAGMFNIPASANVANYTVTFVANNPKTTARATGLLIVTPGLAMQEEIKHNITNMSVALADFQKELGKMKAAGKDVAQANSTLATALELLNQANQSAASSNWLAAFNQLAAARAKFAEAQTKLSSASKATASAVLPGVFDFSSAGLLVGVFLSGVGLAGTAVWIAIEKGILRLRKGALPGASSGAKSMYMDAKQKGGSNPLKRLLERLQRRKKPTAYHWRPGD
jgi:hypothetical protein